MNNHINHREYINLEFIKYITSKTTSFSGITISRPSESRQHCCMRSLWISNLWQIVSTGDFSCLKYHLKNKCTISLLLDIILDLIQINDLETPMGYSLLDRCPFLVQVRIKRFFSYRQISGLTFFMVDFPAMHAKYDYFVFFHILGLYMKLFFLLKPYLQLISPLLTDAMICDNEHTLTFKLSRNDNVMTWNDFFRILIFKYPGINHDNSLQLIWISVSVYYAIIGPVHNT